MTPPAARFPGRFGNLFKQHKRISQNLGVGKLADELRDLSNVAESKERVKRGGTLMNCPECRSEQIRKNGHRKEKQNYICLRELWAAVSRAI